MTEHTHTAAQQLAFPFYRVKLDIFEGPLDLLLHLIKKNEVEIADIPVATITEQYLAHLEMMRELSLDVAGEFLVMAATLMLIKSRMLLPQAEDEEEEADPRAELVQQLLEYQRYREAALDLGERPFLNRDVFVREATTLEPDEVAHLPEEPVRLRASVWDLMEAFRAVLARAKPEPVHEVIVETVSLRDRAQGMLRLLQERRSIEFESLFEVASTRIEIVVTFLALLELMKMGAVQATQETGFGSIRIELAVEDISTVTFGVLDDYSGAPKAAETGASAEEAQDAGDETHN